MKKMLFAALFLAVGAANAQVKVTTEARVDLENESAKLTAQGGTETKDDAMGFRLNRLRVNFNNTVNEKLSYRLRFRLSSPTNTGLPSGNGGGTAFSGQRDGSNGWVDLAYIDHKFDGWKLRLGKQFFWEMYAREGQAGYDYFSYSRFFETVSGLVGSYTCVSSSTCVHPGITSSASASHPVTENLFKDGLGAEFTFGDNKVTAALYNSVTTSTDLTANERKNTGLGYGLLYNGKFADGMVQPSFAYSISNRDADADATTKQKAVAYTSMAAGVKVDLNPAVVEADYKSFNAPHYVDGTTADAFAVSSLTAKVSYKTGEWTPFFKYISDTVNPDQTVYDYKRTAMEVGTWYEPFEKTKFRYHVVYTMDSVKWDSTSATNKDYANNKLSVGFALTDI